MNRIDVFDSDFNDSEEEEDEEEDHDEEQDEGTKRVTTTKQPSSSAGGGEIYNKIAQYFHPSVVEAARIQFRSLAAAAPPQPSSQNALDTTVSTSTARALLIKKKQRKTKKKHRRKRMECWNCIALAKFGKNSGELFAEIKGYATSIATDATATTVDSRTE